MIASPVLSMSFLFARPCCPLLIGVCPTPASDAPRFGFRCSLASVSIAARSVGSVVVVPVPPVELE